MSSQAGAGKKWGVGSFLSQAVAGVEARLDNILAEEDQPNKAGTGPAPSQLPVRPSSPAPTKSESTARSKANDRLQERLARAIAAKQAGTSAKATPKATPSASPRQSTDGSPRNPPDATTVPLPASPKTASSPRASQDVGRSSIDSRAELEKSITDGTANAPVEVDDSPPLYTSNGTTNGHSEEVGNIEVSTGAINELQEERIRQLEKALEEMATQQAEETHNYVEQIDALQSKLQYLAREATDSARKEAREAPAGSLEKKLAEKDQQIAGLMEEGKNLASTELKLRGIIKSLRSKIGENEKEINDVKTARGKGEQELDAMRRKARRADDLEKYQEELHKRIGQSTKEIAALKSEVSNKDRSIAELKTQLQKSAEKAEALMAKGHEEALAKERQRARQLEEEMSDLKVEKELAADRARARENELKEKAARAAERAQGAEMELKVELQAMESKLELMRTRTEEVSSGAMGDSQAKLLRQVETLQTQYAIATDNWQGIESTLLSRISNLEKERDEALQRESEMRKKAREAALRAKRQEEELEEAKTQIPTIQEDVKTHQSEIESLKKHSEEAEKALAEAKAELEKYKTAAAEEKAAVISREQQDRQGSWTDTAPPASYKSGSRPESPSMPSRSFSTELLGFGAMSSKLRKHSAPSSNGDPVERYAYNARRGSTLPSSRPSIYTEKSSTYLPPILSPTIEALPAVPAMHPLERQDTYEGTERLSSSPQQIAQDMVSASTVAAGPSVQLVEKLSAAIRRLETEKVAAKDELTRISAQRDEARAEMVTLMREVESGRQAAEEVAKLQAQVAEVNERYETTLELLGEKSELVEELRADVQDVKAMYRDLIERTVK